MAHPLWHRYTPHQLKVIVDEAKNMLPGEFLVLPMPIPRWRRGSVVAKLHLQAWWIELTVMFALSAGLFSIVKWFFAGWTSGR